MKTRLPASLLLPFLLTLSGSAFADFRFGVGYSQWGLGDSFDIPSVKATFEFKPIERFFDVRVVTSGFYGTDGDNYYLAVGWLFERKFAERWSWGIGGEAGYFSGNDVLGNELEFYTRGLINYHFRNDNLLRLEVGHISNAGFGDINPGSENLALTYLWSF